MTKEEWEEIREKPNISMDIWFNFYRERGGYLDTIEEFQQIFLTMLNNESVVQGSDGVMKKVTIESASRRMREYYDNKFL